MSTRIQKRLLWDAHLYKVHFNLCHSLLGGIQKVYFVIHTLYYSLDIDYIPWGPHKFSPATVTDTDEVYSWGETLSRL